MIDDPEIYRTVLQRISAGVRSGPQVRGFADQRLRKKENPSIPPI